MYNFFQNIARKFKKSLGLLLLPLAIALSGGLSSCFTGIESTKKINLSREDKKLSTPTAEERFISQMEATPLQSWETGRSFLVSDDKALLVIVPQEGIIPVAPDSIKGKLLEFAGVESKINAAGVLTVSVLFSDGLVLYAYDTGKEFDDAMTGVRSDQIPMLIDLDLVAQARGLLAGKKLWSRTNLWYDKEGNRINGRRFVEVTIKDVMPGDMVFPLKVEILTDDNQTAYLFMNYGTAENESRSFGSLFSLSDIKKNYPNIDQETWAYISSGRVKEGMTKEEVRLSLGNPTNATSGHDYSQTLDIWNYDNGKALWFEDGRLTRIRQ